VLRRSDKEGVSLFSAVEPKPPQRTANLGQRQLDAQDPPELHRRQSDGDGILRSRIGIQHPTRRPAPTQLHQHLGGASQRQHREGRRQTLVEADRRLGLESQGTGTPTDRGRREIGRFEEHHSRPLSHLRLRPAHDSRQGHGALRIRDHQHLGGELAHDAVQCADRFPGSGAPDHDSPPQ
jgi:hypothetical protein